MSSILIIGGPSEIDYAGLGADRIDCTPKAILGLHMKSDCCAVVYWPTNACMLSLPENSYWKLVDESGVSFERMLLPHEKYYTRGQARIAGRVRKLSRRARKARQLDLKVKRVARIQEYSRRAMKAKLLDLIVLAHNTGLVCISVTPAADDVPSGYMHRAFAWFCYHLGVTGNQYMSGMHISGELDDSVAGRILNALPLDAANWTACYSVNDVADCWSQHVVEPDTPSPLALFNDWDGTTLPVDLFGVHRNARNDCLSLCFRTGRGAIIVVPPLLSIPALVELVRTAHQGSKTNPEDRQLDPAPSTAPAPERRQPDPTPSIALTLDRRRIRGQQNLGYLVQYADKSKVVGKVAYLRLLAFAVAHQQEKPASIDLEKPMIRGQSIRPYICRTRCTPAKMVQNVRDALEGLCPKCQFIVRDDRSPKKGDYRLGPDAPPVDLKALRKAPRNSEIRSLMALLPRAAASSTSAHPVTGT